MNIIVRAIDICQSPQGLEYYFKQSSGRVHSIKLNSLWHRFEHTYIVNLAEKYKVDLFLDLKLYDTPETITNYIRELSGKTKYLTITYANFNETSVEAAYKAAKEHGIFLFFVSMLSSSGMLDTERISYIYTLMCATIASFNTKHKVSFGVVIPSSYIYLAKRFNLKTLTPGVVLDKKQLADYKNQVHVGTFSEVLRAGGDFIVLGRKYPRSLKELDILNEFIGEYIV